MTPPSRMPRQRFAICINPGEYAMSLEQWKVYPLLPDDDAERHGQFRVIDDTGEDYLFPQSYFHPIELPAEVGQLYERRSF